VAEARPEKDKRPDPLARAVPQNRPDGIKKELLNLKEKER
jgi:hypothetical protein